MLRRALVRIAVFVAVLALLLVGLELVLRQQGYGAIPAVWFDPHVGTRFHPNQTREIYAPGRKLLSTARINDLGFRGPSYTGVDRAGALRIACLGDSFTFGWGVDDEHTYPVLLEEALAERMGEGAVQVLNCGVPGFNTWQELRLYERDVRPLEPDVVIVGWYPNDLDPMSIGATGALAPLDHPLAGTALFDWWLRRRPSRPRFDFEGLDTERARELKPFYDANRDVVEHNAGDARSRPYVERNLAHLAELYAAIRGDGAEPVLLVFPTVGQVDHLKGKRANAPAEYPAVRAVVARVQADLAEHAAANDVPVVDLLDAYMDSEVRPYGDVDLSHPSVHGYELAVDAVVDTLAARGLLE